MSHSQKQEAKEEEEEATESVRDQASKPALSPSSVTHFDLEGAEPGSFKVHQRTFRALFANVEQQIDDPTVDAEFFTARIFLKVYSYRFTGGFDNVDFATNAKLYTKTKTHTSIN